MFVHTATRSLLLQAAAVTTILAAMPAKAIDGAGFNVAVKHTEAATSILRTMGYQAPSPIVSYYAWPKFKGIHAPFDHQRTMAEFHTLNWRGFNLSEMGCVSADTEYLSPTGWRRIDQWDGGRVAQYNPDSESIEFVQAEYVKLPCPEMIRFKTTRGVDQLLSPEHRVLLANGSVVSAEHVEMIHGSQSIENRNMRFRTTFNVRGTTGISLTDAQIRVQVAVNADGYMPKSIAYVRIKKLRKIERMRRLLVEAGIKFIERPCAPEGFVTFSFKAPMMKGFGDEWWNATQVQLEIVAAEAPLWDGTIRGGKRGPGFFGTQRDADFIQYAFGAAGMRSTMRIQPRCVEVGAKLGDPTVGMVSRNSTTEANVRREPSPDGYKYCFMVPSTFLLLRRNGCIVATGNTAKTNAALFAADWMMKQGKVQKVLVLCPLSMMERVWMDGIFQTLMHRQAAVVHGSRDKRKQMLALDVDFYIMNHDGVSIKEIRDVINARPDINLVIVDEGSKFRNYDTDKYKALERIVGLPNTPIHGRGLWWLAGTPCPNAPSDAWAQARLINPHVSKFFGAFRRLTMIEVGEHIWKPKVDGYKHAYAALQPAVRFEKKDCLDLPPMTTEDWQIEMTKSQKKVYDAMVNQFAADLDSGERILAVNAADKVNKLRQILLGSVKIANDNYEGLDARPRIDALCEAIDSAKTKAYVIVPYKGAIKALQIDLQKRGYSVAMVNGDVPLSQRNRIFADFSTAAHPKVLLCHPTVVSHGLNFTCADTLVFYGPIYSNDEYRQVIERFNRPGQTHKMTVIRLMANAFEAAIYKLPDDREKMQSQLLNLYRNAIGRPMKEAA